MFILPQRHKVVRKMESQAIDCTQWHFQLNEKNKYRKPTYFRIKVVKVTGVGKQLNLMVWIFKCLSIYEEGFVS